MKSNFKYLVTNLLILGLTGTMFMAAGCPEETDCTTDADCTNDGETCDQDTNSCVAAASGCADDTECTTAGEYCLGEDSNKTCRQPTDCTEAPDPAVYCANQIVDFNAETQTATCNAAKECEAVTKQEYRYVQVADTSTGDASCDSKSGGVADPGTDLVTIALLNQAGETVGFAKTAKFSPEGTPGYKDAEGVFNGVAPDASFYDENGLCPAPTAGSMDRFREDSVVTLGCGGEIFVEFLDTDGNSIAIDPTVHQVEVTEFGPYCSDNEAPGDNNLGADTFATYLCTTTAAAGAVESSDCGILLNTDKDAGYEIYNLADSTDIPAL